MENRSEQIWREWRALDDEEPSPVKRIALKLGLPTHMVARIVYSPAVFDEWDDSQEPTVEGYDR